MTISVYITSYNQKAYLIEAIESVLAQTLRPNQIIIIDDCSSDGSQDVIRGYTAQYPNLITPLFHEQNQGVTQTRIDALNAVTGEYATYLDGDDRMLPTKLEKERAWFDSHPEVQIVFSNFYTISLAGERTGQWVKPNQRPPEGDVFRQVFAREFPQRVLFRCELVHFPTWREIGFYDPAAFWLEDWEMRVRLSRYCRTAYYDEPLSEYRVHQMGIAGTRVAPRLKGADYVIKKNKPLMSDLRAIERWVIMRKLDIWRGHLNKRAAYQALELDGDRWSALQHFVRGVRQFPPVFEARLLLRILLPAFMYNGAGAAWRAIKKLR
jgi:glycosyltransferase involved in cell wall biosynthesis